LVDKGGGCHRRIEGNYSASKEHADHIVVDIKKKGGKAIGIPNNQTGNNAPHGFIRQGLGLDGRLEWETHDRQTHDRRVLDHQALHTPQRRALYE
jgi:hypothetical protein